MFERSSNDALGVVESVMGMRINPHLGFVTDDDIRPVIYVATATATRSMIQKGHHRRNDGRTISRVGDAFNLSHSTLSCGLQRRLDTDDRVGSAQIDTSYVGSATKAHLGHDCKGKDGHNSQRGEDCLHAAAGLIGFVLGLCPRSSLRFRRRRCWCSLRL